MEMYLFYRAAMGFRLSARDRVVDLPRIGSHLLRQIQAGDQLRNVQGIRMMMAGMRSAMFLAVMIAVQPGMIVSRLMFFLSIYGYLHMCAGYAACNCLAGYDADTGQPQSVHTFQELFFLRFIHQLIQGRHEHIARRSHIAFYIKCSHIS